jgi:hypothetical protein
MLEARLAEAVILKRLLDGIFLPLFCYVFSNDVIPSAIKELVTDANFECNEEGIVSLDYMEPVTQFIT